MGYSVKISKGMHVFSEPNYVQIEAHRGCTRRCDFCGIRFDDEPLAMPKEMYSKILSDLSSKVKRFSYSLHGEPMLNKNLPWFLNQARIKFPKSQLSIVSNGDVLTRKDKSLKLLLDLFESGLNIIQLDLYDNKSYDLMLDLLRSNKELLGKEEIHVKNYYTAEINMWSYHGPNNKIILICDERKGFNSANSATRCFHTWGGNFPIEKYKKYGVIKEEFPVLKQCTEPLRYVAISANGNYLLCCSEGGKVSDLGNVKDTDVLSFWKGKRMQQYRFALKNKRRDIIPSCYMCTKRCFRVGLYPYWGQYEYSIKDLQSLFAEHTHALSPEFEQNLQRVNPDMLERINELS